MGTEKEIQELEGQLVYFSGERYGCRGVVYRGNCYSLSLEQRGTGLNDYRVELGLVERNKVNEIRAIDDSESNGIEKEVMEALKRGKGEVELKLPIVIDLFAF